MLMRKGIDLKAMIRLHFFSGEQTFWRVGGGKIYCSYGLLGIVNDV